jgi:hypothetical protein
MAINSIICGVVLWLTVSVAEKDGNVYNHLLVAKDQKAQVCESNEQIQGILNISFSQGALLAKEGERIQAKVSADCEAGYITDHVDNVYQSWICTATQLEVLP